MTRLYREGYSCGEIARSYGISRNAVWKRLTRAGVTMRDTSGRLKGKAQQ